jgi:hypothetical protein
MSVDILEDVLIKRKLRIPWNAVKPEIESQCRSLSFDADSLAARHRSGTATERLGKLSTPLISEIDEISRCGMASGSSMVVLMFKVAVLL